MVNVPDAGVPNAGVTNVNPVIVAAVPPSEIAVEPTVTELFVNAAFGIAVNPVPIDPEVKVPTLVNDDVTTPLANVVPVIPLAATEPAEPDTLVWSPVLVPDKLEPDTAPLALSVPVTARPAAVIATTSVLSTLREILELAY